MTTGGRRRSTRSEGRTQVIRGGGGAGEGGAAALVRRFRLHVIEGADVGAGLTSSGETTIVGTHRSASLVLTDPTVSRFHCELRLVDGHVVVKDLGSSNGTRVDGVQVLEAPLPQKATLTLGQTRLRYDLGPGHAQVPLSGRDRFGLMVGASEPMRALFAALEKAAESDATVLLLGATGTGKGAAAESIHMEGRRRDEPFVVVDCGAIPPNLLESELFGHETGAFTGAIAARAGAFEAAAGGTLFLDEIGELALDLQPKLLRVLEKHEVKRIGSNKHTPVDFRLIAATNRDLRAEVNAGRFRSDLYYRLAIVELTTPPLRERWQDLPVLVEHFVAGLDGAQQAAARGLVDDAFLESLARHAWPGNVRELRNYLERCVAFREAVPLSAGAQAATEASYVDPTRPLKVARERWSQLCERRYLEELLRRHDGNVSAVARAAGVDRVYIYRLLWRHGLR
jgi:DNA-binding NtrC family response regulator